MPSSPEIQQTDRLLTASEEFRTIARLHGLATGLPECVAALPLRLAQDWHLRANFVELLRGLQRRDPEFALPDALTLLLSAVGGPTAATATSDSQLDEPINLTASFLASVGGWPGSHAEPITDLDNPPDHDPRLDFAHYKTETDRVAMRLAYDGGSDSHAETSPTPRVEAHAPASPSPAAGISLAEITQALARLERGTLDLRLHLDSIDQRLSRMEPLLESPALHAAAATAASAPAVEPPPSPDRWPPTPSHRDEADTLGGQPHRDDPPPLPTSAPTGEDSRRPTGPPEQQTQRTPSRSQAPRKDRFAAAMELPGARSSLHFPTGDDLLEPEASDRTAPDTSTALDQPLAPAPALADPVLELPESTPTPAPPATPAPLATFPAHSVAADTLPSAANPRPPTSAAKWTHLPSPADSPAPAPTLPSAADEIITSPVIADTAAASAVANFGPPTQANPPVFEHPPAPAADAPSPSLGGALASDPGSEALPESSEAPKPSRGPLLIGLLAALLIALAAFLLLRGKPLPFLFDKPASPAPATSAAPPSSSTQPATTAPNPRPANSASSAAAGLRRDPSKALGNGADLDDNSRARNRVLGARESTEPTVKEQVFAAPIFVPESVMKARLLAAPRPLYPKIPNVVGLEGDVVFEAFIAKDGAVEGLTTLGGQHLLRDAAANAVRRWRYQPFLVHGDPVPVRTIIHVNVAPRDDAP